MKFFLGANNRLRQERERLGLNQTEMGDRGCVARKAQIHYESGERNMTLDYLDNLAASGVDVGYILFGERGIGGGSADQGFAEDELDVLRWWRKASEDAKAVALRVLKS